MPDLFPGTDTVSCVKAEARLARVFEATGCRTQLELAEMLQLRQSSIADAKRRGKIPAEWLVAILSRFGVNPEWITTGAGPKYLVPSDKSTDLGRAGDSFPSARAGNAETLGKVLRCFSIDDLLRELERRKGAGRD